MDLSGILNVFFCNFICFCVYFPNCLFFFTFMGCLCLRRKLLTPQWLISTRCKRRKRGEECKRRSTLSADSPGVVPKRHEVQRKECLVKYKCGRSHGGEDELCRSVKNNYHENLRSHKLFNLVVADLQGNYLCGYWKH